MLHLPFSRHQNNGDLVLGDACGTSISPLVRVPASARTANLYVIGVSGKGKSKLLEYCLYQDIVAGRGWWVSFRLSGPSTPIPPDWVFCISICTPRS